MKVRSPRGWVGLVVGEAFILAFVASACAAPQNTFAGRGDQAREILGLYWLLIGVASFVGLSVLGLLLYAFFRFRARPGEEGEPREVHGNTRLEVAWFLAPTAIVLLVGIPSWAVIYRQSRPPPENALQVRVVARQWWWEFRYPQFTLPDGGELVTANELHLPAGRPVHLAIQSGDVIHSFWVPQLAGKLDANPGQTNRFWFTPLEPGVYAGQCAEFCGLAHALMRFRVVVHTPEEFEAWVRERQGFALPPLSGEAQKGWEVFQAKCAVCHTIDGTPARGTIGPNLTGMASRQGIAAMTLPNTPEAMARWLKDPQAVKPGTRMPTLGLSDEEVSALVAFLSTLK